MNQLLVELNTELADVARRLRSSLLRIADGRGGAGSGVAWSVDGLVVTNAHVLQRGSRLYIDDGLDEHRVAARVVRYDRELDLALVQAEATLAPIVRGNSRELKPGELVMAMGYPWGVAGALASGSAIGIERGPRGAEWLVADLRVRPGNSGGPLVDSSGRLLGITTMMMGPELALAVPVHVVEAFVGTAS